MLCGKIVTVRVHFKRNGERRYSIVVERELAPAMTMQPAPGYDDFLPHDLLHFVAEAEWGIDDGVFGQLAAGGDAGTFWPTEQNVANKWKHRGERLRKAATAMGRSEQLAAALETSWRRRYGMPEKLHRRETYELLASLSETIDRIAPRLDELARRWHALQVGGVLTLDWPRAEGRSVRPKPSSASRGAPRDGAGSRARSGARAHG